MWRILSDRIDFGSRSQVVAALLIFDHHHRYHSASLHVLSTTPLPLHFLCSFSFSSALVGHRNVHRRTVRHFAPVLWAINLISGRRAELLGHGGLDGHEGKHSQCALPCFSLCNSSCQRRHYISTGACIPQFANASGLCFAA